MPEWWTYRLSDFLLFSPRTYYRMLEHYNEAVWPAHLITTALGLIILGLLRRPGTTSGRSISATLAVLWVWISWMFLWKRYATINWVASYLVPLFMLQALLLVWVGVVRARLTFRSRRDGAGLVGLTLFIFSLTFYPMLARLSGRPWRQAEIFGVAPDPTTLATLGLLLLISGRPRWELLAIPMLWCSLSGATLWAMDSPEALIPLLTALLVLLASITFRRRIAS
jgi:Family of unknown function (DUF6064)